MDNFLQQLMMLFRGGQGGGAGGPTGILGTLGQQSGGLLTGIGQPPAHRMFAGGSSSFNEQTGTRMPSPAGTTFGGGGSGGLMTIMQMLMGRGSRL